MSTRILICDDHPVVRAGLNALLSTEADLEVVAEAPNAETAIALLAESNVDLVLMDLQLGAGLDGATATKAILAEPHPPYVLILTNYDSDADILNAVEAGASGYLLKDAPPDDLLSAIRAAAAGQSALAPAITSRLLGRVRTPHNSLSVREFEVLALVAGGLTNADIGRQLFVSETTVKSHLVHIFTKLDVQTRTAAVDKARRLGLIRS